MGNKVRRPRRRRAGFRLGLAALLCLIVAAVAQNADPTPDSLSLANQAPASVSDSTSNSPSTAPSSISDPPPLDVQENVPYSPDADAPLPSPESAGSNVEVDVQATGISSSPRRFHYSFQVFCRTGYDDNINLTPINQQTDYFFTIAPQVILGFGDISARVENFLRLDYAPSFVFYQDHSNDNAFQQIFRLTGQTRFSRLTLALTQGIDILDGAETETKVTKDSVTSRLNLDVSGRTKRKIYTTELTANYDFSGKTFVSVGLGYSASDYTSLISSEVFTGSAFLNYRYSPKLVIGVGGSAGKELVDDPNPGQTFEQASVQLTYDAGQKLTFSAAGGLEFRQFKNSTVDQNISPVFNLGASYHPFDGTEVRLDASRRTVPSAVLAGQDFNSTSISGSVRQRFLRRAFLGLSAGYENSEYFGTVEGVNATRQDNYYFVEPSIDISITRFWLVGVFYLRRQNDTSDSSFGFNDNQYGVRTLLKF